MDSLRTLLLANTALLASLGVAILFIPPANLPVGFESPHEEAALVHLLGVALGGSALALLLQVWFSHSGELRRLAYGLSLAYGLIALTAGFEQAMLDPASARRMVTVIPIWPLIPMALALVFMARRPLRPEEIADEIRTLKIPDEIRQGLLLQVGEAAAQEERNRLARDLHDSIKQQLFSITLGTATAQERWESDPEGARTALRDVRRSTREAMVEMQVMLHQLRPEALGTIGLIETLREQCEALGYRTGAEVTVEIGEPIPDDRLPAGAQETLFRMAQETLANVARHARARRVRLWLGKDDEDAVLRIEDDGQGFDPAAQAPGMGLRNLKERAEALRGKVEIVSSPTSGTRVEVRSPLLPAPASAQTATGTWVEPAKRMRAGLRDFVAQAVSLGLALVLFRVPLFKMMMENLFEANAAAPLLLFGPILLLYWWFWPRTPSSETADYDRRQSRMLNSVVTGIFFLLVGPLDGRAPLPWFAWIVSLSTFLVAAVRLVKLHQNSEVRRFWRKEARIWLWPLLLVETGILLAVGLAAFDRRLVDLGPVQSCLLLIGGAAFAYVASRQPRQEGVRP